MKIVKFFRGIFSHPKICLYIFKGLVVAESTLSAAIVAIKEQSIEFKRMPALIAVLKYISKTKAYLGAFISVLGVDIQAVEAQTLNHEETVRGLSTDDEITSSLADITNNIPESV